MSADATAYVWRFSPYSGNTFIVHLAIADSVNDQHEYRFWLSQPVTAEKSRATDRTVRAALSTLEADGFLKHIRGGRQSGSRAEYRFVFKRHIPIKYEARRAVDNGAEESADGSATISRGAEDSSDVTQVQPEPDLVIDNLEVEAGLTPAHQIKKNLRNRGAA